MRRYVLMAVAVSALVAVPTCTGDDDDAEPTTTSEPSIVVPNLIGLGRDAAMQEVEAAAGGITVPIEWTYVAHEGVEVGLVATQRPAPGVRLREDEAIIFASVSMGGPVSTFDELPAKARAHAQTLDGYDTSEPVLVASTDHGDAYKTDAWLFGPCEAVDDAYRTFQDPTYGDSCY